MVPWLLIVITLAWGSFLNVVALRLLHNKSLLDRSHCPHCTTTLSWWELIPVASWLYLQGKCLHCKQPISWLYPFGELITTLSITALFFRFPLQSALTYSLFISALIISVQTDLHELVIIRYFSLGLIPIGIAAAAWGLIPLSLTSSILGVVAGYVVLWITGFSYQCLRKTEGLGEGDMELLAGIGAWTGWLGVWFTLTIASLFGVLIGPLIIAKTNSPKIPFGPLLALGAFIYLMLQQHIQSLLVLSL